ncbi:MAG: ADP-ribosylglycohydrolase family protein, partial [Phycisphaerae bacterium]|nr:ADP-ribosylglycohydrolase family protein [Phycisphaerae bacterium]
LSGKFNNELFHNGMGSPIRAEIWGIICPGNPALAAEYARYDSELDHWESSVHGEQFIAAMEAAAFFEAEAGRLLDAGLSVIPADSKIATLVSKVRRWHGTEGNWKFCRQLILDSCACPDMTNCKQNIALIVMAMLYSGMDFEKAILMAVNSGYDTDCTCATVGSIVGIALGTAGIPERWQGPLGDTFAIGRAVANLPRENSVTALTDEACLAGCEMAVARNSEVLISGAPEIANPRGPKPVPPVAISIEYVGDPDIGFGSPGEVDIVVRNNTDAAIEDTLGVAGPGRFAIEPDGVNMTVGAGQEERRRCKVSLKADCGELPMVNLLKARFGGAVFCFGLSGTTPWKVIGPFPNATSGNGLDEPHADEPAGLSRSTLPEKENPPFFEVRDLNWPIDAMDLDGIFGTR